MNVLEKILEEIEEATFQEDAPIYIGDMAVDGYVRMGRVEEIIRSHMNHSGDDTEMGDWIPVEERLPEDCEEIVLVQVSGKPADNILFDNAFELALYKKEEGWILDNYPEWENPEVIAWQPLPEPYIPPIISRQAQDLRDRESFFMEER